MNSRLIKAKFRVKINSLSEEARMIRKEEKKMVGVSLDRTRWELTNHRTGIVRREQRATLLAYAFFRGVPYRAIEKVGSKPVDQDALLRVLNSLAGKEQRTDKLQQWLTFTVEIAA